MYIHNWYQIIFRFIVWLKIYWCWMSLSTIVQLYLVNSFRWRPLITKVDVNPTTIWPLSQWLSKGSFNIHSSWCISHTQPTMIRTRRKQVLFPERGSDGYMPGGFLSLKRRNCNYALYNSLGPLISHYREIKGALPSWAPIEWWSWLYCNSLSKYVSFIFSFSLTTISPYVKETLKENKHSVRYIKPTWINKTCFPVTNRFRQDGIYQNWSNNHTGSVGLKTNGQVHINPICLY